jgi:hypothetical protein
MANRFWVGGSGTWDNSSTANWSATTGGASGASAPTTGDDAFFDANSGTAATVTVASTAAAASTTINKADIILIMSGNATLAIAAGLLTLTTGTLNLNSNTLIIGRFNSANTNARTIAFGATGKIQLTGSATLVWNTTTGASILTVTGSRNVEMVTGATTGTRQFAGGNVGESKAWNLSVLAGSDTILIQNHINNFNITGFAGTFANDDRTFFGNVTFVTGVTYSSGATSTKYSATSGTQLLTTNGTTHDYPISKDGAGSLQLQDNLTIGTGRTFGITTGTLDLSNGNRTLSAGIFSSSNTNTRSIAFGTGNITLTGNNVGVLSMAIADNFTYAGTSDIKSSYAGATGTRSLSFGATSGASAANVMNVFITAGTDTVATGSNWKNLNFTGFSGTLGLNTRFIYGSLTISSGMTLTAGASVTSFFATAPATITTANKTFDFPLTFDGVGGTFAFQDALTQGSTRAFTVTNGTVKLKDGATSTVGAFATSGASQKFLQSTTPGTQATLSQASGTVDASHLTIQDNAAVGGATWNAFVNQSNIDAGNVDGWNFGISPVIGGAEYTYALRSFTQPRRF